MSLIRADMQAVPDGCSEIFAPCLDLDCERPCGAHRTLAEIKDDEQTAHRTLSIWEMLGWAVVIWVILASAMSFGLAREAHEIEFSERI